MLGPAKPTLQSVLKRPGNNLCADCKATSPRWASVNIGIFICLDCSGIHRDLGTHITKVKSVTLDDWSQASIDLVDAVGNKVSNAYYEYALPADYNRPKSRPNDKTMSRFIEAKYKARQWAPPGSVLTPADKYTAGEDPLSAIPADKRPAMPAKAAGDLTNPEPPKPRSRVKVKRSSAAKAPAPTLLEDHDFPEPPSSWTQPSSQPVTVTGDPPPSSNRSKDTSQPTSSGPKENLLEDFWSSPSPKIDYTKFNSSSPQRTSVPPGLSLSSAPPHQSNPLESLQFARSTTTSPFDIFNAPAPAKQTTVAQNTAVQPSGGLPDLQALGYTLEPPSVQRVQEAKISAAKEAQDALFLSPRRFGEQWSAAKSYSTPGFGEPYFPTIHPASADTLINRVQNGELLENDSSWAVTGDLGFGEARAMNSNNVKQNDSSPKAATFSSAITRNLADLAMLGNEAYK